MKQLGARMAAALIGACLIGTGSVSHAGTRAIYSDDGVSEIRASEPWAVRPDISATAALRVADVANENYLIVNTYLPEEIEPKPLAAFAEEVSAALSNNLQDGKLSKARKLTINGWNALEYEISGKLGEVSLVYLSRNRRQACQASSNRLDLGRPLPWQPRSASRCCQLVP